MLTVVVCLVLVSLALVSVARRSMQLASTASGRQRQLQQQWGAVSCQRTLLPAAPGLFDARRRWAASDGRAPSSVGRIETRVVLGGLVFDLLVSDEDAKINLNAMYRLGGRAAVERAITLERPLQGAPPVRLRPLAGGADGAAFDSWGQVFDLSMARPLENGPAMLPLLSRRATCWGSGKLNVRQADPRSVGEVVRLAVSDSAARRLSKDLAERPLVQLDQLIDGLTVAAEKRNQLRELLSEQSTCYSLWVVVPAGGGAWRELTVAQTGDDGICRTVDFRF